MVLILPLYYGGLIFLGYLVQSRATPIAAWKSALGTAAIVCLLIGAVATLKRCFDYSHASSSLYESRTEPEVSVKDSGRDLRYEAKQEERKEQERRWNLEDLVRARSGLLISVPMLLAGVACLAKLLTLRRATFVAPSP